MEDITTQDDYPLVSAIMLAGKTSIPDVLSAINCFKKQTYPYKELIIVNNAKSHFDATALNIKAEKDIFLVDTPFQLSTGMARNYGISAANGKILAQFDPDFWYAPTRLESQIANLAESNAHIAVFGETLAYSFVSGRATYHNNERKAILNTMVFIRPANIDYPNVENQEELGIMGKMQAEGMTIISVPLHKLACKLQFTAGTRVKKPINCGLLSEDFKLVKRIVKDHRE